MVLRTQALKSVFLMVVMWTVFVGCREIKTSARLQNGPVFLLDGSGRLASFRIYGPVPGHKIATPFDGKSLRWYVQPSAGYFKGSKVQRLVVKYGIVPTGYTQTVPTGRAPQLDSNVVYYFFAETTDAPPAEGFFYLDGDVPTEIVVPGLCQSAFVGDVKPLKCGTSDPYAEPTDLHQFVRENHVQK